MLRYLVQVAGDQPCDLVALNHVRHLARLYQARAHVAAVLDPIRSTSGGSTGFDTRSQLTEFLACADKWLQADGVAFKTELILGEFVPEAARLVDLADLMIVGLPEHGSDDTESRYRISLAEQFFKEVPRALWLARGDPAGLRRILVGYDGSADAGHALRLAADLAERVQATLHLLTANDGRNEKIVHNHFLGAQAYLKNYRVETVPLFTSQRPGPALLQAAEGRNVDLIAVGATGHEDFEDLVFGNATQQVIRQARCAVMVAQ